MGSSRTEIIAHRGLHVVARENTFESFELAVTAGADAIELDVHATRDGKIVVHHDPEIPVGSDRIAIDSTDLAGLTAAAAKSGFDLPVLGEVLERMAGRAKVYIEVKALGIELLVARVVRESACEIAVHSFDHRVVRKIRDFVPGIQTGILTVSRPVAPASMMAAAGATDYWPHLDFVDQELVDEIHDGGGRVIVWTPNTNVDWVRLAGLNVDGLCTDRCDEAAQANP
jgi:glycerophosphoryl diester phosphodiesterase